MTAVDDLYWLCRVSIVRRLHDVAQFNQQFASIFEIHGGLPGGQPTLIPTGSVKTGNNDDATHQPLRTLILARFYVGFKYSLNLSTKSDNTQTPERHDLIRNPKKTPPIASNLGRLTRPRPALTKTTTSPATPCQPSAPPSKRSAGPVHCDRDRSRGLPYDESRRQSGNGGKRWQRALQPCSRRYAVEPRSQKRTIE